MNSKDKISLDNSSGEVLICEVEHNRENGRAVGWDKEKIWITFVLRDVFAKDLPLIKRHLSVLDQNSNN